MPSWTDATIESMSDVYDMDISGFLPPFTLQYSKPIRSHIAVHLGCMGLRRLGKLGTIPWFCYNRMVLDGIFSVLHAHSQIKWIAGGQETIFQCFRALTVHGK